MCIYELVKYCHEVQWNIVNKKKVYSLDIVSIRNLAISCLWLANVFSAIAKKKVISLILFKISYHITTKLILNSV